MTTIQQSKRAAAKAAATPKVVEKEVEVATPITHDEIEVAVKEEKKAVVFLSNRVHLKDNREKWIEERDFLIKFLISHLTLDQDLNKKNCTV